jgi:hypothetical protein
MSVVFESAQRKRGRMGEAEHVYRPTDFPPTLTARRASSVIPSGILLLFTLAVLLVVSCLSCSAQGTTGVSQNLFVAGYSNHSIMEYLPGGATTTFASSMGYPIALAFDPAGNLYSADEQSGDIYKFANIRGVLSSSPSLFASGLSSPEGLASDSSGDLFVACLSGSIIRITSAGTQSTFASGLNQPVGVTFDTAGNLFVADQYVNTIYKYTPGGVRSTFATNLAIPEGLTVSSSGNLLAANWANGEVTQITPDGGQTTFASGFGFGIRDVKQDSAGDVFVSSQQDSAVYEVVGGSPVTFAAAVVSFGMAFQPIPEPSAFWLAALGGGVMALTRGMRRPRSTLET